ncbi:MAG: hypothetical protein ACWA41_02625 [Putridiphycobacter sp.]
MTIKELADLAYANCKVENLNYGCHKKDINPPVRLRKFNLSQNIESTIYLYPNPASDFFNISIEENENIDFLQSGEGFIKHYISGGYVVNKLIIE